MKGRSSTNGVPEQRSLPEALCSLIKSAATLASRASARVPATPETVPARVEAHCERLGLDLGSLPPIVHVAGTKGKGSTCAFVESVLRTSGLRTGLFTSPHLVDVRERVRLNGAPVATAVFERIFWSNYDELRAPGGLPMPGFFEFMLLLALRVFVSSPIDVLVLEVGLGGRLDATTAVAHHPAVCGVTLIDLDHTEILGPTLAAIAREKAGILKPSVPALTVGSQSPEALEALRDCASTTGTTLSVVKALPADLALGLAGEHQRENAALAVALCTEFLRARMPQRELSAESVRCGLERAAWPGRAHVQRDGECNGVTYYLDGAHTPRSVEACLRWFCAAAGAASSSCRAPAPMRVLVFNCAHTRDAATMLATLAEGKAGFAHATFCCGASRPSRFRVPTLQEALRGPNAIPADAGAVVAEGKWQETLRDVWSHCCSKATGATAGGKAEKDACTATSTAHVEASIESTVAWIRTLSRDGRGVDVLVTGSLLLVGGVLGALGWAPDEDDTVCVFGARPHRR